jgi:hypothetical protein
MKKICLGALLLVCFTVSAQTAPDSTVPRRTEISELAKGYAEAFLQMSASRTSLYYRYDNRTAKLVDLKEIQAMNGVLLIRFGSGDRLALSAGAVLFLTDGKTQP